MPCHHLTVDNCAIVAHLCAALEALDRKAASVMSY
jgi:hypothetical protein